MTSTRTTLALCALLASASAFTYACGDLGASAFGDKGERAEPAGGTDFADAASRAPPPGTSNEAVVDNAVILVHAAKSQSFRLCFAKEPDRRPQPDSEVMPNANVVGVEVGAAVRLGPLAGPPGEVYLFDEPLIRAFYPAFGGAGAGPTCGQLLANSSLGNLAVKLGPVDVDLSTGVHLLVVRGCTGDTPSRTYDVKECGADWTASKGNLSVKEITLAGSRRPGEGILPAQVVNLSQSLESMRGGRSLVISFGALDGEAGAPVHVNVATNPLLFGSPSPVEPAKLSYDSSNTAIYESLGFRVALVAQSDAGADSGGASTRVLDESLARIQKSSSPRDVPPTYFAAASNYALLVMGDPNDVPDSGADNERQKLHILAVPVIGPKANGGSDAGPDEPGDGG